MTALATPGPETEPIDLVSQQPELAGAIEQQTRDAIEQARELMASSASAEVVRLAGIVINLGTATLYLLHANEQQDAASGSHLAAVQIPRVHAAKPRTHEVWDGEIPPLHIDAEKNEAANQQAREEFGDNVMAVEINDGGFITISGNRVPVSLSTSNRASIALRIELLNFLFETRGMKLAAKDILNGPTRILADNLSTNLRRTRDHFVDSQGNSLLVIEPLNAKRALYYVRPDLVVTDKRSKVAEKKETEPDIPPVVVNRPEAVPDEAVEEPKAQGPMVISISAGQITIGGRSHDITPDEGRMVREILRTPRPLSPTELVQALENRDQVSSRAVQEASRNLYALKRRGVLTTEGGAYLINTKVQRGDIEKPIAASDSTGPPIPPPPGPTGLKPPDHIVEEPVEVEQVVGAIRLYSDAFVEDGRTHRFNQPERALFEWLNHNAGLVVSIRDFVLDIYGEYTQDTVDAYGAAFGPLIDRFIASGHIERPKTTSLRLRKPLSELS